MCTGNTTVDVINHTYGEQAGKVARDGFEVVQDVYKTGRSLHTLGVKGLVKKVAVQSGKNIAENLFSTTDQLLIEGSTTTVAVIEEKNDIADEMNFVSQLPITLDFEEEKLVTNGNISGDIPKNDNK